MDKAPPYFLCSASGFWGCGTMPGYASSLSPISYQFPGDSAASFTPLAAPGYDVNRTPFKVKAYGLKQPLAKGYNKSIETE